jgi:hypothetical protein
VDYHVAHKIESLKYIYTGGHTNCQAVAIAFKENGALDYDNVYNPISGAAIRYSQNSATSSPTTPAIKNF